MLLHAGADLLQPVNFRAQMGRQVAEGLDQEVRHGLEHGPGGT
jgi:hypothetical protein